MGNCWPSPVNHHSQCTTKPSSPVQKDAVPSLEEINLKSKEKGAKTTASPPAHGGVIAQEMPPSGQIVTPKLKMFTYAELMKATREFRPDTVLGEGGFGRVFKGWVDEETLAPSKVGVGMPVAVKKLNSDSSQGFKEWQSEVKFLGKLSHPNLVRLLGYCWEDNQFLLVYEHMQKGSLESHLFRRCADPLPWDTRLKIATGAAHGLACLHSIAKQVIYRDFKPSNILLDGDFNAKLSDFGLAKLGPEDGKSHITTGNIVGTYGYAAPEYVATGRLYVNSDVYGFGVVLLEILTGLRVIDNEQPYGQHNLVDWATPLLPDKRKLKKIMDPRLEDNYPPKAAFEAAQLALSCLQSDPKNRPSMEEVVDALNRISSVEMTKPKKSRSSAADHHRELRGHHSRSPLHHRKYHGNGGGARSPLPGSS